MLRNGLVSDFERYGSYAYRIEPEQRRNYTIVVAVS